MPQLLIRNMIIRYHNYYSATSQCSNKKKTKDSIILVHSHAIGYCSQKPKHLPLFMRDVSSFLCLYNHLLQFILIFITLYLYIYIFILFCNNFFRAKHMDTINLLCDEVWLSNSTTLVDYSKKTSPIHSFYTTKQDYENAFCICLEKEELYMPRQGFFNYLHSQNLISPRFRAIQWLIKCCSRFNLSFVTLFNAANYLDRFISSRNCLEWKNWMVELVCVACLSVASKFSETSFPSLHEIQMEELDHNFQPITIRRMELMVLNTLGWRLNSTTTYSYVELLMNMRPDDSLKSHRQKDLLVARVIKLLLGTILDCKMVEYRPSVAAICAICCSIEELIPSNSDAHLAYIAGLLDQNHKDDFVKCRNIMEEKLIHDPLSKLAAGGEISDKCPSSPVTVLLTGRILVHDDNVDLSRFKVQESDNDLQSNKKRRKLET